MKWLLILLLSLNLFCKDKIDDTLQLRIEKDNKTLKVFFINKTGYTKLYYWNFFNLHVGDDNDLPKIDLFFIKNEVRYNFKDNHYKKNFDYIVDTLKISPNDSVMVKIDLKSNYGYAIDTMDYLYLEYTYETDKKHIKCKSNYVKL